MSEVNPESQQGAGRGSERRSGQNGAGAMATGPANHSKSGLADADESARLLDIPVEPRRLTHQLFRFPAKFHPPVVRRLIQLYSEPGDHLYEPFCGSGTGLVEAAIAGRPSTGLDVDPLAVAVAHAKTRRYDVAELSAGAKRITARLERDDRGGEEYVRLQHEDIPPAELESALRSERLWVPKIPNLEHWFRRYVIVDLARMRRRVNSTRNLSEDSRAFFSIVFASIIRNASNADPVPVSGLEVTSHMKQRDADGRVVDPYALFRKSLRKGLEDVEEWVEALGENEVPTVLEGDVTEPPGHAPTRVGAIITSPPYHNAVDYYRRHQLEMFWLGLTADQSERLALLPRYIGRPRIQQSHPFLTNGWKRGGIVAEWEMQLANHDEQRARDFRHYMVAMEKAFARWAEITDEGAPVVLVLGRSCWNGVEIPTTELFQQLAGASFEFEEELWYPVKNRYMSYSRQNGANINREYVLVMRRR